MDLTMTDLRSISAYGPARSSVSGHPLEPDELQRMQRYWNATLYLSAGMIYLRDNPLLREPLKPEHVKRRLLGHWGSDPGMSLVYIHLNRLIKKYDLDVIFLAGSWTWRAGADLECLPGRRVLGDLQRDLRRRRRHAPPVQAVLLPRRDRQPLHAGDARFDSRRRRARLFGVARLWRGLRQPGSHRHRHGRRRRSGDRAARDGVALEQVSQSGARRCGAAGAASQRLQDRKSDNPFPHLARGAGVAVRRLRLRPLFCRGFRPGNDASGHGRHLGPLCPGDSAHPAGSARKSPPGRSGPAGR